MIVFVHTLITISKFNMNTHDDAVQSIWMLYTKATWEGQLYMPVVLAFVQATHKYAYICQMEIFGVF